MIARQPTFELDSIGWYQVIGVGFYDGTSYRDFIRWEENEDVLWKFLSYLKDNIETYDKLVVVSEAGERYGNIWVLNSLLAHNETVEVRYNKKQITWKIEKPTRRKKPVYHTIVFGDANNLLRWPIKDTLKMLDDSALKELLGDEIFNMVASPGTPKGLEGPLSYTKQLLGKPREKTYKDLKSWEMGEEFRTFRSYLAAHTIQLSEAVSRLKVFLLAILGATPSITLASSVMKAYFAKFLPQEDTTLNPNIEFEKFTRRAIYGGRCEVYKRYGESINAYDIKSMFPSCYDVPVPIGKMEWISKDKMGLERGSIAEATVHVPEDLYIGPLPHRNEEDALEFPVGIIRDVWDMYEIRNAVEKFGVKVLKWHKMVECEEKPVLKGFKRYMETLRNGNNGWDPILKEVAIQPSGKFGQKRLTSKYEHIKNIKDLTGYTPLDEAEIFWEKTVINTSPQIVPAITMRIRAVARIRHLDLIMECSKLGEIFYGDTDSIYTTAVIPTFKEMGKPYLVEEGILRGYFVRQKLYGYVRTTGALKQKSAGYSDIKLSEDEFSKLLKGEEVDKGEYRSIPSLQNLLSGKELEIYMRHQIPKGTKSRNRIEIGKESKPLCYPQKQAK